MAIGAVIKYLGPEIGEASILAMLNILIGDAALFFNVGKNMNPEQVKQTSFMIMEEYNSLKPDDLKMCFTNAKKGLYGKVYDRIDGAVVLGWLETHFNERCEYFVNKSLRQHDKFSMENRNSQYDRAVTKQANSDEDTRFKGFSEIYHEQLRRESESNKSEESN